MYFYMASTLLGNAVYGLATFNRVLLVYIFPVSDNRNLRGWATFVQCFIAVVFCILCGNVSCLVVALRDNARFKARLSKCCLKYD